MFVCDLLDLVGCHAIRPSQERLDASRSAYGPAQQQHLVRGQAVAEPIKPPLLDVRVAVLGDAVNQDGQDVVMQVLEMR